MDDSKSISDGERELLFKMKEECKMSCVKIFLWSIVTQKGININILLFYIFEYGAEYGAECSAESGAK